MTMIQNAKDIDFAGRKRNLMLALIYMAITFFVLYSHCILGAYLGLVGFSWIIFVTVATLFTRAELAFTLLIVNLFMQNTFISLAAPGLASVDNYNILMATSFLTIVL